MGGMSSKTWGCGDREVPNSRGVDVSRRDGGFMIATGPISSLGEIIRHYRTTITDDDARRLVKFINGWLDNGYFDV